MAGLAGGRRHLAEVDLSAETPAAAVSNFDRAVVKITSCLTHLIDPDQVVEVRALEVDLPGRQPCVCAGTFRGSELEEIARAALELSGSARGIYYTPNPLHEKRFALQAPRIRPSDYSGQAHDVDVRARRWIMIDLDPVRAVGFENDSATDAEKAAAWDRLVAVRAWLSGRGWPEPIISDSGNGYHLLYRLAEDLPASGKVGDGDPIRLALVALAHRFDDDAVKVDRKLYNPSRILKFPGTLTRKGPGTPERPHRRALVKDVPSPLGRVAWDLVQKLADEAPAAVASPSLPTAAERTPLPPPTGDDPKSQARRYMAKLPGAVAGQRGHDRTYQAARLLVNDFGLDETDAADVLHEWNLTCQPPWDSRDIDRKVSEASRKPYVNRGHRVRESYCQLIENVLPVGEVAETSQPFSADHSGGPIRNFRWIEVPDGETTKRVQVGRPVPDIVHEIIERSGGWPKLAGGELFVETAPGEVRGLRNQTDVFGWMHSTFAGAAEAGVDWQHRVGPSRSDLFVELKASPLVDHYQTVELFPHEPRIPDVFYSHPRPIKTGTAMDRLLSFFNPATQEDECLLRAMFLTLVWGGPPGQRPAFFITTADDGDDGRGSGKTTVVELFAEVVGGCVTLRQDEKVGDLALRLLSGDESSSRVVLLDNVKSLKFSSATLESLITGRRISGRKLYVGNASRPNFFVPVLTANAGSLSKDLAQRSIVVHVTRPKYTGSWLGDVQRHIEANRWAILGDAIAALREGGPQPSNPPRWGAWCSAVLACATVNTDALCDLIRERSLLVDEDQAEAELVREQILRSVARVFSCTLAGAESHRVWLSPGSIAELVRRATGERMAKNRATRHVGSLGIRGLKPSKQRLRGRGYIWAGDRSSASAGSTVIDVGEGGIDCLDHGDDTGTTEPSGDGRLEGDSGNIV